MIANDEKKLNPKKKPMEPPIETMRSSKLKTISRVKRNFGCSISHRNVAFVKNGISSSSALKL